MSWRKNFVWARRRKSIEGEQGRLRCNSSFFFVILGKDRHNAASLQVVVCCTMCSVVCVCPLGRYERDVQQLVESGFFGWGYYTIHGVKIWGWGIAAWWRWLLMLERCHKRCVCEEKISLCWRTVFCDSGSFGCWLGMMGELMNPGLGCRMYRISMSGLDFSILIRGL